MIVFWWQKRVEIEVLQNLKQNLSLSCYTIGFSWKGHHMLGKRVLIIKINRTKRSYVCSPIFSSLQLGQTKESYTNQFAVIYGINCLYQMSNQLYNMIGFTSFNDFTWAFRSNSYVSYYFNQSILQTRTRLLTQPSSFLQYYYN